MPALAVGALRPGSRGEFYSLRSRGIKTFRRNLAKSSVLEALKGFGGHRREFCGFFFFITFKCFGIFKDLASIDHLNIVRALHRFLACESSRAESGSGLSFVVHRF